MFFAHMPAGYLLSRSLVGRFSRCRARVRDPRSLLVLGMLCAVLPDIDWFYFLFVDHGHVHHHRYVTHWPLFWTAVFAAVFVVAGSARVLPRCWQALTVAMVAVYSHIFLDWIVSAIWMFEPFSDRSYNLVVVPARYSLWYLNFFFYWTGLLDFGIATWGTVAFLRDSRWGILRGATR